MILNAEKIQAVIMKQNTDMCKQYTLNIDGNQVSSEKSLKQQGINIDNNLSFNERVSSLCKKARNQLNAMNRLHRYLGGFFYANFN